MIPEQLRAFVSGQIDRLQATYPPNRLAALAAILLAAPAAAIGGWAAIWVPVHFPGIPALTSGQYTAAFITGAAAAAGTLATIAYRFIDGVQINEHSVTGLAESAAARDHEQHLETMRLESAERIALVEKAHDADHAAELLGITSPTPEVARSSPAGALSDTLPPLPTDLAPAAPIDPVAAPAPVEPPQPVVAPQSAEPGHVAPEPQSGIATPSAVIGEPGGAPGHATAVPPPDRV